MSKLVDIDRLFNGGHFDREVIVPCVRWDLRYKLSLRDLVEIMAERGVSLEHTTSMRCAAGVLHSYDLPRLQLPRSRRPWRTDK
jgi:transposase-like protein